MAGLASPPAAYGTRQEETAFIVEAILAAQVGNAVCILHCLTLAQFIPLLKSPSAFLEAYDSDASTPQFHWNADCRA